MSLWRQLTRGLRALTNRAAADQDTADEVEDFFEQATAALEASGLTPDEARRRARLELGSTLARELLERSRSFDSMAVVKPWGPTLTGSAEPERLDGQRVSVDYFRAFAVAPALGRDFEAADDQLNGPGVVVLSHALWRRRFNSDAAILGRHMMLDDEPYTVVGVMPATFENVLLPSAQLWAPHSGVLALLVSVSAIACCVPAWRAARVDPAITLRAE